MSATEINDTKWATLASISGQCIIPDGINATSFVIIHINDGICLYNSKRNEWNRLNIKLEQQGPSGDPFQAAAFHYKTKQIYHLSMWGKLSTLQLNNNLHPSSNAWKITSHMQKIVGAGAYALMIKNQFHVIGGYDNNKHIKYNVSSNTFDIVHIFNEFGRGFGYHQTVLLKHNLFMFGGFDIHTKQCFDTVYQYNITANIWNKLQIKLPKPLDSFGCTAVINGTYALLFGGFTTDYASCDHIYIFSMVTKTFVTSEMRCPEHGRFKATTINDKEGDEKTVFGFVRNEWETSEISDHRFPPQYLLRLIHSYYLVEFVDLINCFDGGHWIIDVFEIIGDVL